MLIDASLEYTCTCGTTTTFGLMEQRLVGGAEVRCCPGCHGVLLANVRGRWLTAKEVSHD